MSGRPENRRHDARCRVRDGEASAITETTIATIRADARSTRRLRASSSTNVPCRAIWDGRGTHHDAQPARRAGHLSLPRQGSEPRAGRSVGWRATALSGADRWRAAERGPGHRGRRAGTGAVPDARLYQLVRQGGPITDRTFEIAFLDPAHRPTCSRSAKHPRDGSQRKCSSRGGSAPATSAAFPVVGGRSRDVAGPNHPGLAMRSGDTATGPETRPRQSAGPGIHGRDVGTTGPTFVRHHTQSERRPA